MKPARLYTLTDKYAYQQVFSRNSCKSGNRYFLLLARINQPEDPVTARQSTHSRIGIVVSRKNVRKACQRHLIKRIVRESFRQTVNYPESSRSYQKLVPEYTSSVHKTFDCVFLARSAIPELNKKELAALLNKAWNRLVIHIQGTNP